MDIKILENLLQVTIDRGNLRNPSPQGYSKDDYGQSWSSQEWKSGVMEHDRSGKPETVNHQEQAYSENFVMGSDAAEFVDKVKDKVRNRQKRMSNVAESGEEHSIIWGMFVHGCDVKCSDIHGKEFFNYSNCCQES